MKKYIVLKEFADKDNFAKHYLPGDELPGSFAKARLEYIVTCGLAKVVDEKPTAPPPVVDDKPTSPPPPVYIDLTGKVSGLLPRIKEFADAEKLRQYLEAEKSSEKPRQTVVKAIEDRLATIEQVN